MLCARCSTRLDNDLAFCTNCGLPQTETPTVVLPVRVSRTGRFTTLNAVLATVAAMLGLGLLAVILLLGWSSDQHGANTQSTAPPRTLASNLKTTPPKNITTSTPDDEIAEMMEQQQEQLFNNTQRTANKVRANVNANKHIAQAFNSAAANATAVAEDHERKRQEAMSRPGCFAGERGIEYSGHLQSGNEFSGILSAYEPVSVVGRQGSMYRVQIEAFGDRPIVLVPVGRIICN